MIEPQPGKAQDAGFKETGIHLLESYLIIGTLDLEDSVVRTFRTGPVLFRTPPERAAA